MQFHGSLAPSKEATVHHIILAPKHRTRAPAPKLSFFGLDSNPILCWKSPPRD